MTAHNKATSMRQLATCEEQGRVVVRLTRSVIHRCDLCAAEDAAADPGSEGAGRGANLFHLVQRVLQTKRSAGAALRILASHPG